MDIQSVIFPKPKQAPFKPMGRTSFPIHWLEMIERLLDEYLSLATAYTGSYFLKSPFVGMQNLLV